MSQSETVFIADLDVISKYSNEKFKGQIERGSMRTVLFRGYLYSKERRKICCAEFIFYAKRE